ncbi:MFS transporter [Streptomyces griseocarneus]|nr:MFS transporter [Streptomyces griseocarneus]
MTEAQRSARPEQAAGPAGEAVTLRSMAPLLAILCTGLFMVWLDTTIVNVALPDIQDSLGTTFTGLQWVVNVYTLTFACFMLVAGDIGDLFGHKRVFLVGVAGFTAASALCATAPGIGVLLAARGLQGASGAVIMPISLSLITAQGGTPRVRAAAVGLWSGVGSLGLAGGPLVGGLLVTRFGWASVFWINVPIGLLALLAGHRVIAARRGHGGRPVDTVGMLLFAAGVGALTLGLIQADDWGWTSPAVLTALCLAALLLTAFTAWELRARAPVLPPALFRDRGFTLPNLAGMVTFFGMFGVLLFLSVHLQSFDGLSAYETGLRFLPLTAATALAAPLAGWVTGRYGARLPLAAGCAVSALGMLLLTRVRMDGGYLEYVLPFVLVGFGTTLAVTPGTIAVLAAVRENRAGMGAGIVQTSRQIGGVLGIAVLGTVVVRHFRDRLPGALAGLPLPSAERARVVDGLSSGGRPDVSGLPAAARTAILHPAGRALADSIQSALAVAAVCNLAAALLVLVAMPRRTADSPKGGAT